MKSNIFSFVAFCGALTGCPQLLFASCHSEMNESVDNKSVKPNIILITTDQQSYNTISALSEFNRESNFYSTPNIDRIVNSGTAFNLTYCSNPVSVPSRFSLYTGLYGGRFSIRENLCRGAKAEEVRPVLAENGMGHVFAAAGYETVYGGKVHLPYAGINSDSKFAAPDSYGFQQYLTKDERAGLGQVSAEFIKNRKPGEKPFLYVANFLNPHDICLEGSTNISEEIKGGNKKADIVATVKMMRERAAAIPKDEFYGNIAPQLPYNFEVTAGYPDTKCSRKRFLDLPKEYWRKYRWTYAELVKLVDEHIGEVLDALDANPEIKKNTIVIFTSDHGEMQGAHRSMTKSLPFEECQRVPFVFAGRGIPKGKVIKDVAVNNGVDLLPTMCELAGIDCPEVDGVSLAGCLQNGKNPERNHIYIESETFVTVIKDGFKYTYFDGDGGKEILINLKADYGEMKNIASSNPQKMAELKSIAMSYERKIPAGKVTKASKKNKKNKKL